MMVRTISATSSLCTHHLSACHYGNSIRRVIYHPNGLSFDTIWASGPRRQALFTQLPGRGILRSSSNTISTKFRRLLVTSHSPAPIEPGSPARVRSHPQLFVYAATNRAAHFREFSEAIKRPTYTASDIAKLPLQPHSGDHD